MVMETKQIICSVNIGDRLAHLTAITTGPGKQGNKMVYGSKNTIWGNILSRSENLLQLVNIEMLDPPRRVL
jgi:hypothetical protein